MYFGLMRMVTLAIGSLLLRMPLMVVVLLLGGRNGGFGNVAKVGVEVIVIGTAAIAVEVDVEGYEL